VAGSRYAADASLSPSKDLLPLRLPFRLQLGGSVLRNRPKRGGFADFAWPARSPTTLRRCAPRPFGPGLLTRLSSCPAQCRRAGFAVATNYPLGNCVGTPVETSGVPDSVRTRFLIAPRRAAPDSQFQMVATPSRGAGDICRPPLRQPRKRNGRQISPAPLTGVVSGSG
jgi:hypothetical protein